MSKGIMLPRLYIAASAGLTRASCATGQTESGGGQRQLVAALARKRVSVDATWIDDDGKVSERCGDATADCTADDYIG